VPFDLRYLGSVRIGFLTRVIAELQSILSSEQSAELKSILFVKTNILFVEKSKFITSVPHFMVDISMYAI